MTVNTTVKASPEVISTEIDGEAVLMHVSNGLYYGLNSVGSVIWANLEHPIPISHVCAAVSEEFEVDDDTCTQDVVELLRQLSEVGLVEIVDA